MAANSIRSKVALGVGGAVAATLCAIAAVQAVNVTVDIGSASGQRGAIVNLAVILLGDQGPYAGAQVDMLFPTGVLSVVNPSSPCSLSAPGMPPGSVKASFPDDPPAPAGQDRLRVVVVDTSDLTTFGDGTVAQCAFQIAANAPIGAHAIPAEKQVVSSATGTALPSQPSSGSVTVLSPPGPGPGPGPGGCS